MAADRNELPEQVTLDLDAIQAEKREKRRKEIPFTAKVEGRVITFRNPKGVNWYDLAMLSEENPVEFIDLCIEDEDEATHVISADLDSDVMSDLIDSFMRHYGLDRRRGNRSASRR